MEPGVADASETLLGIAAERPDPRQISNWLAAYLAARPAKAHKAALAAIASALEKYTADPARQRPAQLVLAVVRKMQTRMR